MYTINIPAYAYYDNENFQVRYSLYVDDELYNTLKSIPAAQMPKTLQTWEDLAITPAEAITRVNAFLNARYIGNHTEFTLYNPMDSSASQTMVSQAVSACNAFGCNIRQIRPTTGDWTQFDLTPSKVVLLNGAELDATQISNMSRTGGFYPALRTLYAGTFNSLNNNFYAPTNKYIQLMIQIVPSDFISDYEVNPAYANEKEYYLIITINFDADIDLNISKVTKIEIKANSNPAPSVAYKAFNGLELRGAAPDIDDYSNPYSSDGTAGPGGGDGTLPGGGLDSIDPAEIPDLPAISAADLGFITMYNPTAAQLKTLSDFMWSNLFDLNTYKKLFSDPMQSVIGLAIVPVAPTIGGSKNVHFGTIDSGVSMSYLSTNYVQLDCGSVACEKYVGCFMDNDPYTKISIYLPFIGIRQLSADDVIGGSIHVVYNIDVLTGACACFIEHSTRGVLYSYNGSCITNVPLTSVNFSGAIQNAVAAIGSAIGVVAGMATGAAPLTAMSAAGLMTSAANTALNSKAQVQRSGNLGGSAGIMSIMTPYVIIERPALSVPNNVQKYTGQTSNITMSLNDCKGFTMCEYIHLDNISATSEEIVEIESMLKAGVIL